MTCGRISTLLTITSASPTIYSAHAVAVLSLKYSPSPPNTKIGAYALLSSYVFVYKMLIFSLLILKENFDLAEGARAEKCSLLIVNTDSPFSLSTFSNSTHFLGILETRSSHGNQCFDASYQSSSSCAKPALTVHQGENQHLQVT